MEEELIEQELLEEELEEETNPEPSVKVEDETTNEADNDDAYGEDFMTGYDGELDGDKEAPTGQSTDEFSDDAWQDIDI